jgi:hypothetical protein
MCFLAFSKGNNDINMLDSSPLVKDMLTCKGHGFSSKVHGSLYPRYYLLANNTYFKWSCFVQIVHKTQKFQKKSHFAMMEDQQGKTQIDVLMIFNLDL